MILLRTSASVAGPRSRVRWSLALASCLVTAAGCDSRPATEPTASLEPPPPSFEGQWAGSFELPEVMIGGVLPVAPHPVDLSLKLAASDGKVEGLGTVTNLLGDMAPLAMVSGPQRGKAFGVVVDGVAEISLDIPPFGAPPAPASVVFSGRATGEGLIGTCRANLAGGESAPVSCTLGRVNSAAAGGSSATEP